jgi:uncharacterized membrane protein
MAENKLVVGFSGVNKPTPKWATYLFRVVFILTGVVTFIVAADPAVKPEVAYRIGIYLKGLDMAVWGFTRIFGIEVSRDYNYENGEVKN